MSAPEVHGTYPVPEELRRTLADNPLIRDMFIARKPWEPEPEIRFPRVTVDREFGLDELLADDFGAAFREATHKAVADLDRQVGERVLSLPDGWRLCVHDLEVLTIEGWEHRIAWRKSTHGLPPDCTCEHPRRTEWTRKAVEPWTPPQ